MWGPVLDKYCDKFELFALKNSFKISPSLRTLVSQHNQNQAVSLPENSKLINECFQQHEEINKEIEEMQQQIFEQRCKNEIMSRRLDQLDKQLPSNLDKISETLDEYSPPISQIIPALESLTNHYHEYGKILQNINVEVASLPVLDDHGTDIDANFQSHSKQTNIQSIEALQSITDAMEE